MILEKIKPIGQVVTQDSDDLPGTMKEIHGELAEEIREKELVPLMSGDYHMEIFALSSCIYARVATEVISHEEASEAVREAPNVA